MSGLVVNVSVGAHEEEQTYGEWGVAACVFEANLHGLVSDGFAVLHNRCGPDALHGFATPEADDLYTARSGASGIESVSIDAADPIAIYDGTGARLHRSRSAMDSPKTAAVSTAAPACSAGIRPPLARSGLWSACPD